VAQRDKDEMVSTTTGSGSLVYERRVVETHRYHWPGIWLNTWLLIMLACSCTIIGIFSVFISIQNQLLLPVPWYFPYFITVGALVVSYIVMIIWLVSQRRLLPGIVMIGAFILFILWLVGLIVVSINLWGPTSSVSTICNLRVFSQNPTGETTEVLAWLQQRNICQSWQAIFALALVGAIFLLWIMVMAYQVFVES
jgi:hypothetical protein